MRRVILLVAMAAFLNGCIVGGRNMANTKHGIKRGNQVDVEAGRYEADSVCTGDMEAIDRLARSIDGLGQRLNDATATASSDALGSEVKLEINTTSRRIARFDQEVDLSYQNANSSCRAFSRCMQNNYYDEGQCRSTLASWERARSDFNDLSRELREIEAETDRLIAALERPVIVPGGGKHKKKAHMNTCECGSNVGPFSNCCDVSSDQEYERKSRHQQAIGY